MADNLIRHDIVSCTSKGRTVTALDKKKKKWVFTAHSEAEAELMAEAVVDRGYVFPALWTEQ